MLMMDVLSDVRRSLLSRGSERRARRAGLGRTPRILVIGTCQGSAVAQAMSLLLPDAAVTGLSAFTLNRRFPRLADLLAEARRHDFVFTNHYLPPFRDGGDLLGLLAETRAVLIPSVVFAAFHPDQVRVGMDERRPAYGGLLSPMGHAHSALALFGHLEGVGLDGTLGLYDGRIYGELGYYDQWNASAEGLRVLGAQAGYDFDADLIRWSRRGCFMHSDNHPKMYVAADLARGLLDKAGIPYVPCDLDSYLADTLIAGGTWPVYPDIARHYGVPGNTLFFKVETPRSGPARTMTLRAFVEASFARYRTVPDEALTCARVAAWRADPAIRGMLRAAAGR
ncbi:hypothetical protein EKPJFOCH_0826 [Methylobacterium thuringiense]|uniref:Polysaccharide biosynthesis enzyme WcbI domain-containing protein n=2 Tax=Methylobacteriaceae TaxID=119045 RepID=A0ABQ4THC6_9HYPH|nr:hypothetical protein EKPJFOCH_0826 [Methylobacterium thuringiense]